jgi:glyoxylase-like metal-dependent hydrolase (beta-lactamase superfamily II)
MYRSLHDVLGILPDETKLFPGHNYAADTSSTIGHEKHTNPMLRFKALKDFLAVMSPLRS